MIAMLYNIATGNMFAQQSQSFVLHGIKDQVREEGAYEGMMDVTFSVENDF